MQGSVYDKDKTFYFIPKYQNNCEIRNTATAGVPPT